MVRLPVRLRSGSYDISRREVVRDQPLDGALAMAGRQVRVTLHHRQGLPASEILVSGVSR